MQTVKEASNAFEKVVNGKLSTAFEKGVEFAQKWIPLNEEKPEHYELNGLEYMPNPILVKKGDQIRLIKSFYQLVNFTHWRPVEYPLL